MPFEVFSRGTLRALQRRSVETCISGRRYSTLPERSIERLKKLRDPPRYLNPEQIVAFDEDGVVLPVPLMSAAKANELLVLHTVITLDLRRQNLR